MFAQNRLNPRTQKDQSAHLGRAEIWINGVRLSDINFDLQRCEVTEDLEAIGMVTLRLYHEARLAALRRGELQYWSDDRRLDIGNSLEAWDTRRPIQCLSAKLPDWNLSFLRRRGLRS
jgi:hypothetical protein